MIDAHTHLENGDLSIEYVHKFIDAAKEKGITHLQVLDHTHRFFEFKDCYKRVCEVSTLQEEWFLKKLEVCYTPETESLLSSILKNYHFDFLIGSVHSVDGYLYDMDAFSKELLWNKNDPSNIYKSYYDAIEKLIQSNLFDQVGHPDVIKLYSIDPGYDLHPTYHHIARLANEYKIKMEDNTKAHYSYHHPDIGLNADFRNILKENNVKIVTASDAHYPNDVGRCFELLDPR